MEKSLMLENLTALHRVAILPWTEHLLTDIIAESSKRWTNSLYFRRSQWSHFPQRPLGSTSTHHLISLFLDPPFPMWILRNDQPCDKNTVNQEGMRLLLVSKNEELNDSKQTFLISKISIFYGWRDGSAKNTRCFCRGVEFSSHTHLHSS